MSTTLRALSASLLLAGSLAAQTVLVVDAAGGPGSQFTDIQPAIGAATDGTRILVRPGTYRGFTIVGKSLSVFGEPGVRLTSNPLTTGAHIAVFATNANQPVVVTDIQVDDAHGVLERNGAYQCSGLVAFERVHWSDRSQSVAFENSADVRLSACVVDSRTHATGSTLSASNCTFRKTGSDFPPRPALQLTASEVVLSRCDVFGGNLVSAAASSAVDLDARSTLTLTDDGSHTFAAGLGGASPLSAVTGQGSLVRDPMVVLQPANGAPPVAVGSDRILSVPSLQLLPSHGGTTLQIELTGHPHSVYGLVVGSATAPWSLPGLGGTLFVGPPLFADGGVIGGQPVRMTCQIPAPPLATMLVWQAVGIDGAGGLRVSNPGFHVQTR